MATGSARIGWWGAWSIWLHSSTNSAAECRRRGLGSGPRAHDPKNTSVPPDPRSCDGTSRLLLRLAPGHDDEPQVLDGLCLDGPCGSLRLSTVTWTGRQLWVLRRVLGNHHASAHVVREWPGSTERRRPGRAMGSAERRHPGHAAGSAESRWPGRAAGSAERRQPGRATGSAERRRPG